MFLVEELFTLAQETSDIFLKQAQQQDSKERQIIDRLAEKWNKKMEQLLMEINFLTKERNEYKENYLELTHTARTLRNKVLNFGEVMSKLRKEIEFERSINTVLKEENRKITELVGEMKGVVGQS